MTFGKSKSQTMLLIRDGGQWLKAKIPIFVSAIKCHGAAVRHKLAIRVVKNSGIYNT
jgi:hypothetical protein